ncbi:hypothetical protein D3C72_1834460 [compost metagenome]
MHCALNVLPCFYVVTDGMVARREQVIRPRAVVLGFVDHHRSWRLSDAQGRTQHTDSRFPFTASEVHEREFTVRFTGTSEFGDSPEHPGFCFVHCFFQRTIHRLIAATDIGCGLGAEWTMAFHVDVLAQPHDRVKVIATVHIFATQILRLASIVRVLSDGE